MKLSNRSYIFLLMVVLGGALVAQYNTPDVERLLNDGVKGVAFQSDGKMVLVGKFDGSIARIDEQSNVDDKFADKAISGLFNDEVGSVVINSDDEIIVGGKFTTFDQSIVGYLVKLDPHGNVDQDFLRNMGSGFDDHVYTVVLQPDGKVLVGGAFKSYNGEAVSHIARLKKDGSLDTDFKVGSGFDKPVNSISLAETGEINVGGQFTEYNGQSASFYVKLNAQGSMQ